MKILMSILVSVGLSMGMYVAYVKSSMSSAGGNPSAMISETTVQVQMVNLGQAERMYYIANNKYATLEELDSSGTFQLKTLDPSGYAYKVEASATGFKAVATHMEKDGKPTTYPVVSIDETMKVHRSNE